MAISGFIRKTKMRKAVLIIILLCLTVTLGKTIVTTQFNSGEISPKLYGRHDLKGYYAGEQKLENFIPHPQGGVQKRPGTYYISEVNDVFHPAIPGEVVYGDYTDYFVSGDRDVMSGAVVNINVDNTYRTDWGSTGTWGDGNNQIGYAMYQLTDGRIFVLHYGYQYDATHYVQGAMLDTDGTLDTSWGYEGHYCTEITDDYSYKWIQDPSLYTQIHEKSDGNFIILAYPSAPNTLYGWHIMSSDGECLLAVKPSDVIVGLDTIPRGSCWYDDNKTRLMVAGDNYIYALNPDTLAIDTTWGTNGFMLIADGNPNRKCLGVLKVSDGFIVTHCQNADGSTISKINLTGTAFDTSWATNGHYGASKYYGYPGIVNISIDSEENLYYNDIANTPDYTTKYFILKLDSDGVYVNEKEFYNALGSGTYYRVKVINDIIYSFTSGLSPAQYMIERWTTGLVFIDGVDPATWTSSAFINDFILNEYTRPSTTTIAVPSYWTTTDPVRLLPFQYSTNQSYILELGQESIRFYKEN